MNRVQILDCTLRDGGYCNQWQFGFDNTKSITAGLVQANIDIIECGFITDKVIYDINKTKFTTVDEVGSVIPNSRDGKLFVAMMNYGEYDVAKLPVYSGTSIDGIRIAFHKKDLDGALNLCKCIKEKGYKVFVQPMVSLSYTDEEFLNMIYKVNELQPYAFYIVDSFGMMKEKDLIRLFYMVEHNLNEDIWIGFHSHNNMQLAYSNAQCLVNLQTNRELIIDSSIYGMGRGAGNLNTELFVEHLNSILGTNYLLKPLLNIIDEILNRFYQRNYWGYSLSNYLSASHNVHPNYANFLDDKKTLTVEGINEIFDMIEDEKKFEFDKEYIEKLYFQYMTVGKVQEIHKEEFKKILAYKNVLLIAPGKSSEEEKERIVSFAKSNNVITISVNFDYQHIDTDFIFLSNKRRFRELERNKIDKCIITSNIQGESVYLQVKYVELLNEQETVSDNAGLMAIKFLIDYKVKAIYLAGFDGYSHDVDLNYGDSHMGFVTRNDVLDALNLGMEYMLKRYAEDISINFLTKPRYIKLHN